MHEVAELEALPRGRGVCVPMRLSVCVVAMTVHDRHGQGKRKRQAERVVVEHVHARAHARRRAHVRLQVLPMLLLLLLLLLLEVVLVLVLVLVIVVQPQRTRRIRAHADAHRAAEARRKRLRRRVHVHTLVLKLLLRVLLVLLILLLILLRMRAVQQLCPRHRVLRVLVWRQGPHLRRGRFLTLTPTLRLALLRMHLHGTEPMRAARPRRAQVRRPARDAARLAVLEILLRMRVCVRRASASAIHILQLHSLTLTLTLELLAMLLLLAMRYVVRRVVVLLLLRRSVLLRRVHLRFRDRHRDFPKRHRLRKGWDLLVRRDVLQRADAHVYARCVPCTPRARTAIICAGAVAGPGEVHHDGGEVEAPARACTRWRGRGAVAVVAGGVIVIIIIVVIGGGGVSSGGGGGSTIGVAGAEAEGRVEQVRVDLRKRLGLRTRPIRLGQRGTLEPDRLRRERVREAVHPLSCCTRRTYRTVVGSGRRGEGVREPDVRARRRQRRGSRRGEAECVVVVRVRADTKVGEGARGELVLQHGLRRARAPPELAELVLARRARAHAEGHPDPAVHGHAHAHASVHVHVAAHASVRIHPPARTHAHAETHVHLVVQRHVPEHAHALLRRELLLLGLLLAEGVREARRARTRERRCCLVLRASGGGGVEWTL